jgi:uncharacterized protein YeaO (DUF488 family)
MARVYDAPGSGDGVRVLVDRLWPRGLAKADATFDEWVKDAAPSNDLRRWYAHEDSRYAEFRRRYLAELEQPPASDALAHLRELAAAGPITLLTATRTIDASHLTVLTEEIG